MPISITFWETRKKINKVDSVNFCSLTSGDFGSLKFWLLLLSESDSAIRLLIGTFLAI